MMRRTYTIVSMALAIASPASSFSFVASPSSRSRSNSHSGWRIRTLSQLHQTSVTTVTSTTTPATSFIDTELRGAAMKLHTTAQSPKEGTVQVETPTEPYVPTHADYLQFLVDSRHVYQALEEIVNERSQLELFRNTSLERVAALNTDIAYMCSTFSLPLPPVGQAGLCYATHLRSLESIPEFMCHYYNFYFAHTAGGRMIGKQMASLLLNKQTLEFYKWERDLNEIKQAVKANIELMAATWTEQERKECVDGTAMAFRGGRGINSYLNGGKSGH